ncbi:MAG TPA: hypothetical protein VEX38_01790 [Fimbriimonadaceae bacterium]|nr:hypothetical protein [Fimbriimonadaceae bacterium]
MSTPVKDNPVQPKVNRKLAVRFAIGLISIAGLLLVYNWIQQNKQPGLSTSNTTGYLAALMQTDEGTQAVVFKPDGTMVPSPDYEAGASDAELAWSPDGNGVYFTSDRYKKEPHVYRWDIGRNAVDRRTLDRRAKGQINFEVPGATTPSATALMVVGGTVVEYDPKEATGLQVLPPPSKGVVSEEGGRGGQFDGVYQQIGTSFRTARWGPKKEWIAAIMKREDGEVLIVQDLVKPVPPQVLAVGQKLDFDIGKGGELAIAIQSFQFPDPAQVPPEFIKNGKLVRPYHHRLAVLQPNGALLGVVADSINDEVCFGQPKISPDGQKVIVVVGPWKEPGYLQAKGLFVLPFTEAGARGQQRLKLGEVTDAVWNSSGDQVAFVAPDSSGKRSIFTVAPDGSGERNLSAGKGDFRSPIYSPQTK